MNSTQRKFRIAIFCILLTLSLAFDFPAATAPSRETITILYTNDFHAAVEPMTATWLVDQPPIGGALALAGWIQMLRNTQPNVFLFDSGDLYTGQAISFLTRGQALVDIWKAIGFDATLLGNHEFDYGLEGATNYSRQEPFPVLASNLFYKKDGSLFAKPYAIVEKNGIKIAVIGVFGPDAASATTPATWDTLEVRDPAPILNQLIPQLRRQADLVVVLAHEGETGPMQSDAEAHPEVQRNFDTDKALAAAVPGIDVLVAGHAHRGIEVPWVSPATGTIIVQTYGRGTTLGFLQVTLDREKHRVTDHQGSLLRIMDGVFPAPAKVATVVKKWEVESDRAGREVIGNSTEPLLRNYNGESSLGDLITAAMLWKSVAQIAFENAGGIRGDLPSGTITRYDAISALPFMNTSMEMNLSGKDIRSALEQSLTLKVGMLQIAGMWFTYDLTRPEYHRLIAARVGDEPLNDAQIYKIAASSFVGQGGDHYSAFLNGKNVHDTGELLSDVLTEYIRHVHTVSKPAVPRMIPVKAGS